MMQSWQHERRSTEEYLSSLLQELNDEILMESTLVLFAQELAVRYQDQDEASPGARTGTNISTRTGLRGIGSSDTVHVLTVVE
jgi:hypothetical protein